MAFETGQWKRRWTTISFTLDYGVLNPARVDANRQREMTDWLLQDSNPGAFVLTKTHFESETYRANFYISDPNVAFAFKMRFC